MKLIDKFLKKLNTSRNTFVTYVLTLISFYLAIDRIVEMLLMIFTGVSVSYWGPFKYTLAMACPIFAYLFSPSSEFATSKNMKVTLFYTYVVTLYIIVISMVTQWVNQGAWLFLISLPGYTELVTNFSELIKPALTALAVYFPLVTFYEVFKWIKLGVDDSKDQFRSIWDYKGISLADTKVGHGPFTCDMYMCSDFENGNKMVFTEKCRYQSLLACGGSGTGKTSLILEPMMAKDLEKKAFYRANAKEMGYTALKTGIAKLNRPYDNDYLNENFNLSMITPTEGREDVYKAYMSKMILASIGDDITYRDLGITTISPDFESTSRIMNVCKNYHIKYNLIDPANPDSIGLNPFVYDDATKIAVTISSVLKGMCSSKELEQEEVYREEFIIQALENITIMLKEMYPRLNGGNIPNLEDMLKMLTNFDLVEKMCEIMRQDQELAEKYSSQITYFKKNFYANSAGREATSKYIYLAVAQLDNLLRLPGVKTILCNRHNNIDFDKALANGEVTLVCTRRGDLGRTSHKAFGLFFILSMQNAVLRRPGNEKTRIPHYLYIDEFPDFVTRDTETIFTMYRKYCVGTTISAQSISMFGTSGVTNVSLGDVVKEISAMSKFNSTILSNCASKVYTGGAAPIDELQWWQKEIGQWKQWQYKPRDFDAAKGTLSSSLKEAKYDYKDKVMAGSMQFLTDEKCAYKIVGDNGAPQNSDGIINFMAPKFKEKHKGKKYDFTKYTSSDAISDSDDTSSTTKKFNPRKVSFKDKSTDEVDPIQSNSNMFLDNDDAIVVNFKKDKK